MGRVTPANPNVRKCLRDLKSWQIALLRSGEEHSPLEFSSGQAARQQ